MDFDVEVFQRHAIAKVAIQPVGLLDQNDAARLLIAQKAYHLAELLSASGLGRLYVHEFSQHIELVALGVFPKKLQLCGDRKTSRSWSLLETLAYKTACLMRPSVGVR